MVQYNIISLLRTAKLNNLPIDVDDDVVFIGQIGKDPVRFPRDSRIGYTPLKASDSYSLGTVVFFLKNYTGAHGSYVTAANKANASVVSFADRKDLLQFFASSDYTSKRVYELLVDSISDEVSETGKRSMRSSEIGDSSLGLDLKKVKTDPSDTIGSAEGREFVEEEETSRMSAESELRATALMRERLDAAEREAKIAADLSKKQLEDLDPAIRKKIARGEMSALDATTSSTTTTTTTTTTRTPVFQMRRMEVDEDLKEFQMSEKEVTQRIRASEKVISDRNSVLMSDTKNFSFMLKIFDDLKVKVKERKEKGREAHSSRSRSRTSSAFIAPPKVRQANISPIIVVPEGQSCLVNMINASNFLRHYSFSKWEDLKAEMMKEGKTDDEMQEIQQRFFRPDPQNLEVETRAAYKIVNDISKFTQDDWDRVIAVFVLGKRWQFKDWPWDSIPEIFANVCGFYICYDDTVVDPQVKQWNVKILKISRFKRHLDPVAVRDFWNTIDRFVPARKPNLKLR